MKSCLKGKEDWFKLAGFGGIKPEGVRKEVSEETLRARNGANAAKQREERAKKLGPCMKCGFDDLRAIQLHHINRSAGDDVMPLCANCHRIFHVIVGPQTRAESQSMEEVLEVLEQSSKLTNNPHTGEPLSRDYYIKANKVLKKEGLSLSTITSDVGRVTWDWIHGKHTLWPEITWEEIVAENHGKRTSSKKRTQTLS